MNHERKLGIIRRSVASAQIIWSLLAFSSMQAGVRADTISATMDATSKYQTVLSSSDEWTWTGMQLVSGDGGNGAHIRAGSMGSSGVYVFAGSGVKVYGVHTAALTVDGKPHPLGKLTVRIDGQEKAVVDQSIPPTASDAKIFQISDLTSGNHVLQLKVTEGWGAIDYIVVEKPYEDGGKTYRISPRSTMQEGLDVAGSAMDNNSTLILFSRTRPGHSLIWSVVSVGNGKFRISPKDRPEQAMTILDHKVDLGDNGQVKMNDVCGLMRYRGAPEQLWTITPTDSGCYKISDGGDRCLNVFEDRRTDGAHVMVYGFQGKLNDQWFFVEVPQQEP